MAEEENRDKQVTEDPFTRMMFGSRHENMENEINQPSSNKNDIDYEELMETIDQIVESAKSLKPYFQKIYPIIERLWKKE